MLKQLIHRPIAVTMTLMAIVALGLLVMRHIPVSLMPDVDIPCITVQMASPGSSVAEIEQQMVAPMRKQLAQVAGLKEIRSVSRMDAGNIAMTFEPGANMDLLFIDVNEKVDRAMNAMPKSMSRPKVMKASAMDIPAFYVEVCKNGAATDVEFAQMSHLVRNVVAKRIEQLPQVAMVDYSGYAESEIDIIPDKPLMQSLGLKSADIEKAISDNNILLEALSVVNGIYRYTIHFDSQMLSAQDIENVYIRHEGRLLQIKDVAQVDERTGVRNGIVRYNGNDAVSIAVVKQADAQMDELKQAVGALMADMQADYPDLGFHVTRDQTELLQYTMSSLEGNLLIGAFLASLLLFVFNGGWRKPLLVIISIPMSLIITILCFYLLGISLNIISLSGLILGIGMIVDNSIVVIDSISQRRDVVIGTRDVFTPMLSSVLTTCSVFIPLIFLSGTAGALFHDQAFGIAISLAASLAVATLVVPVYYHALYRGNSSPIGKPRWAERVLLRAYEPAMRWTLRHGRWCFGSLAVCLVMLAVVMGLVRKERMPHIDYQDAMATIDWNANISAQENDKRVGEMLAAANGLVDTSVAMVGTQKFMLSHTSDITSNEAVVYIKCGDAETLGKARDRLAGYVEKHYPEATVDFGVAANIYNLIFQADKPDLEVRLQHTEGGRPSVGEVRQVVDKLRRKFPMLGIQPVATEQVVEYVANPEKMALYDISYSSLYAQLRELVAGNSVYELANGEQSVPVRICGNAKDVCSLSRQMLRNAQGMDVPLEYIVDQVNAEAFKRLCAGSEGEYYPVVIEHANDEEVEEIVEYAKHLCQSLHSNLLPTFHGNYYESRQMVRELAVVFAVAVLLLWFILAAQFESLLQPLIILSEIAFDVSIVVLALWLMGESLNIMSMIGIVVMSGIVINDSILKVDTINNLLRHHHGISLLRAVVMAGRERLKPIVMTSLTTIFAMLPFLTRGDEGSALQYPLSLTIIVGMTVGTVVSLFFVPLLYMAIYRRNKK